MTKHTFKRVVSVFLAITFCLVAFGNTKTMQVANAQTIEELQSQIEQNKKKRQEYNNLANKTAGDISKEKENQEAISEQIVLTQDIIKDLQTKIDTLTQSISDTEELVSKQEAQIAQGVEDYKKRLRTMYLSGNTSYAEILVGSSDFFNFLMNLDLIKSVAKHDDEIISDLITLKEEYEQTKADLLEKKTDAENSKAEYDENQEQLNELFSKSKSMMQSLEEEKQHYLSLSAEQKAKEEELQKEVDRLIEEKRRKDNSYVGGIFTWPTPGYTYITSPFGWRWGRLHAGVDISGANIYGKPIVAANSGTVIIAKNTYIPHYSYGKYVAIDHGGGYVTVYGHCSSVLVSVGQQVKKGETIALVGSTGDSTGPHLHFEIRVNGVKKDPMGWFS